MAMRYINLLSIDVALGAAASAAFFGKLFDVFIRPQALVTLALSVWIIYTVDHLLDARAVEGEAASERHRFHQRHFLLLAICVALASLTCLVLVFFMRSQVVLAGIGYALVVAIYLFVNRWLRFVKEVTGTLLYTGGVILPALVVHAGPLTAHQTMCIVLFGIVVMTNMLLFAALSWQEDHQDHTQSLATLLGPRGVRIPLGIVIVAFVTAVIFGQVVDRFVLILVFMEVLLVAIALIPALQRNDRYRLLGDGVFLLPLLILL